MSTPDFSPGVLKIKKNAIRHERHRVTPGFLMPLSVVLKFQYCKTVAYINHNIPLPLTKIKNIIHEMNKTVSQFRGRILRRVHSKGDCVTATRQGCPISKAPSNADDKCSLLYPDLKDTPDVSFPSQRIPRFIARWIFSEMASERAEAAVAANYIFIDKTMLKHFFILK